MSEERTVADGLFAIASALKSLGNADACTPMGAMEALGKCVLDSAERIADAIEFAGDRMEGLKDAIKQRFPT